jgi:hypothetical protein
LSPTSHSHNVAIIAKEVWQGDGEDVAKIQAAAHSIEVTIGKVFVGNECGWHTRAAKTHVLISSLAMIALLFVGAVVGDWIQVSDFNRTL